MPIDPGILDSMTNSSFLAIGEMGTVNAITENRMLGMIGQASLANSLNRITNMDPAEASALATLGGTDTGKAFASIMGAGVTNAQSLK